MEIMVGVLVVVTAREMNQNTLECHDSRHQEGEDGGEREGEGVDQPVGEEETGEEDREHAGHQHQVDRADPLVGLHHAHVDDVTQDNGRGHGEKNTNTQPVVSALLHLIGSLVGPAGQVGGQVGGEVCGAGLEQEGRLLHQDITQHNLHESLNLFSSPTDKKTEQH